jgi:hypothetical protein
MVNPVPQGEGIAAVNMRVPVAANKPDSWQILRPPRRNQELNLILILFYIIFKWGKPSVPRGRVFSSKHEGAGSSK